MTSSILKSDRWSQVTLINEGWSKDQKYHLIDYLGNEYLLRLSRLDLYEKKKWQFKLLNQIELLNLNTPKPLDFGVSDDKTYMLLTYLKGDKAETTISSLTEHEQYNLGLQAGLMLQKLHSLDIGEIKSNWYDRYVDKINRKLKRVDEIEMKLPKIDLVKDYILSHIELVKDRPSKFQHGDYHLGNMLINNNELLVIDFDKMGIADPIDEFKPFCWNVFRSHKFEIGFISSYYNHHIPSDFFPILALYAAESLISHLPWAMTFGDKEVDTAINVFNHTLDWFDDFKTPIPSWFTKD